MRDTSWKRPQGVRDTQTIVRIGSVMLGFGEFGFPAVSVDSQVASGNIHVLCFSPDLTVSKCKLLNV